MKRIATCLIIGLALLVNLLSFNAVSASQPLKVDKNNPVSATDIVLAKKVTVDGDLKDASSAKAPSSKPSKTSGTANGTLGTPCIGTKYAIVIGISDYPGNGSDLTCSDDDAEDMALALNHTYGFTDSNIIRLVDCNGTEASGKPLVATRQNILSAIEAVGAKVTANDEVVFFFSGHGGNGRANDGDDEKIDECIWSHDGSNFVPIWDGELKAAFSGYNTSRIVFIFDSCYAGGMTDLAAPGRVIAMASSENSLSYEWPSLNNGEFTYYMIEQGMTLGKADKYNDSSITGPDVTVEEAYDYAKANRIRNSPTVSDSFTNDLLP
jgi:hypothetical protein